MKIFFSLLLLITSASAFALGAEDEICRKNLRFFANNFAVASTAGFTNVSTQISIEDSEIDKQDYRERDVWGTYSYHFTINSKHDTGRMKIKFDVVMNVNNSECRVQPSSLVSEYSR